MTEADWKEAMRLNLEPKALIKKIHERYGEIFEAEVEYELITKQITDWVNLLILKGHLAPAKALSQRHY